MSAAIALNARQSYSSSMPIASATATVVLLDSVDSAKPGGSSRVATQ